MQQQLKITFGEMRASGAFRITSIAATLNATTRSRCIQRYGSIN